MPAPLDPETRTAIEQAIERGAGTVSCRGLAKEFEVSASTIRSIAKKIGRPDAFARAQTKNATAARTADMAARRAGLATRALDLAERMLTRATSTYVYYVATKDHAERVELDEPPLSEVRQAATAYGIFIDKHMALIRFDTKDGPNQQALSLVDALVAGFGLTAGADVDDGYPVPLPAAVPAAAAERLEAGEPT